MSVVIRVDGSTEHRGHLTLEAMQELVGGLIDFVYPCYGRW